jgi:proteic killer suppression protein
LEVRFRTRRLEECYQHHKVAVREFGDEVARRYIQRINVIKNTRSVDELRRLPVLRFHALSGSRQGQYAINLNGFYRLIVTLHGATFEVVQIEEVSKHYGD